MNISQLKSKIAAQTAPLVTKFKRYHVLIFLLTFLGIYGFLIIRVSNLTQSEPTSAQLGESLGEVKRLRLDQDSIDNLLELEEQNIEVRSLFEQARDNPFTE